MSKKYEDEIKRIEEMYQLDQAKTIEPMKKSNKHHVTAIDIQQPQSLVSTVIEGLRKSNDVRAVQLSLPEDPKKVNNYSNIYKNRNQLVPNEILKRIRDTEELIGGVIIPVRARQAALFARPRANRFDIGFDFSLLPHIEGRMEPEQKDKIKHDIYPKLRELLLNCGKVEGISDKDRRTFSQWMMETVEDRLTFGGFATEIREDEDGKFHSFKAVDTGTIYFTVPQNDRSEREAQQVRAASVKLLEQVTDSSGSPLNVDKFFEDDYTYVQVIDAVPVQVFTDKELLYWNGAPSTDIYRSGYPVSPVERILSAVSTHINLTTHNKLFFVNGRGARNILVFKSDNVEEEDVNQIRSQMTAHINSAGASWRMPVFGMGQADEVEVVTLDGSGRDMEFQYLADLNKRMIFAAYQMSPDEVAALSYLSRGTNSQSLAECLHYDTKIMTPEGLYSIGDLVSQGKDSIKIWTGLAFEDAKVFSTEEKVLTETTLSSGLSIKTSPDHYFRVIERDGSLGWRPQFLLDYGDIVVVDKYMSPANDRIENLVKELNLQANNSIPEWVNQYHFDEVTELVNYGTKEVMYDVTVKDEVHAFVANGIIVHNSNNEFKLVAARDSGLRPLLLEIEDFLNERVLPRINKEWSKILRINLTGYDASSPEKESTQLQQDSQIYLTMNDIMSKVEKETLGLGGEFPLNAAYLQIIEKYFTKGEILKVFGGDKYKDADQNPDLQYYMNDPVWLQLQQMKMQQQAAQQQMEMAQQQAQQQATVQAQQGQQSQGEDGENLDSALEQLNQSLSKSENRLPASRKEILKKFKTIKGKIMKDYEKESKEVIDKMLESLDKSEDDHDGCDHE